MKRLTASLLAAAAVAAIATAAQAARPVTFATQAAPTGALVLPLSSAADLETRGAALDAASRAAVAKALTAAKFTYKPKAVLSLRGIGAYDQIVVLGTGSKPLTAAKAQDLGGAAAKQTLKETGPVSIAADGVADAAQIAVGASLAGYSFDVYKQPAADPADRKPEKPAPVTVVTANASAAKAAWDRDGQALVEAVAFTRDLVTEPANALYPEEFVARTRKAFEGVPGVTIEVLDVPAMEKEGMGAILGVGMGSKRPPRMLAVHYKGPGAPAAPVALAGKGITFDSGGISIKPNPGMWKMKDDMAGAAAVAGTVLSLAKSKAPVNVVAIAALAENMPDGAAIRPGDVLKTMTGKTIEIWSTDAEGRLVLADGVAWAEKRYKPAAIVDVATLTGAVVGALASDYAGVFSRHDGLAEQLDAAGKTSGEAVWRLPMHPSYAERVKSDIADIKNTGEPGPGAGLGAQIIGFFVSPDQPWAHIDIAGTAWADSEQPTVPKGATGYGVRLLDRFVRDFKPVPTAQSEAQ
ncbi:leucyl aminopeptidase [Caulobacter sp. NIBR2454]|uniref:leucyl aminopeptidase n=1 Tax=Caulobacter sp. NIBR2454 TaxID=3015996 RepID=UPI0022B6C042|nr:leucyl aminopeptidase [Caulobacter sp. NIBR2454]